MDNIRVDLSFLLLAVCSVKYDGRAASDLEKGTYLIIHKSDGTLLIHGATLFNPLNYQSPGAVLKQTGPSELTSTRKKESIIITVDSILWHKETTGISNNKIKISKTERELRAAIVQRLPSLIGEELTQIFIEHPTPYGPVDILAIGPKSYHVIEVKRGKASLAACAQLERYLKYYHEIKQPVKGWIMSPAISSGAQKYCESHNLSYRPVTHHQSSDPSNPQ